MYRELSREMPSKRVLSLVRDRLRIPLKFLPYIFRVEKRYHTPFVWLLTELHVRRGTTPIDSSSTTGSICFTIAKVEAVWRRPIRSARREPVLQSRKFRARRGSRRSKYWTTRSTIHICVWIHRARVLK